MNPKGLDSSERDLYNLFCRNLSRLGIHHLSRKAKLARYALQKALKGEEIPKKEAARKTTPKEE